MTRAFLIFSCLFSLNFLTAQTDTLPGAVKGAQLNFAVTDAALLDDYLPRLEFLDRSARDQLIEQNLKAYMMPPRRAIDPAEAVFYALASCLEFYVNVDDNYKVNLSPDYIRLATGGLTWEEILQSLRADGTVSAAIMPFGSRSIPAGVGATQRYRVERYFQLFLQQDRPRHKILHIRKALARGNPVLVFLNVDEGFGQLTEQRFYTGGPMRGEKSRQPFVVIGFDEELDAVELLGYYGRTWGDNGYMWVDYDDFARLAERGYVLQMDQNLP